MTIDPGVERALTDAMTNRTLAAGVRQRLAAARTQAEEAQARSDAAAQRLAAEERDVDALEDLTWTWIWAKLQGKHASELEREKAEADAARYTAATEQARARTAADEVTALERQLRDLGDVDTAYAAALDAKAQWLQTHPDPGAARLAAIAEELGAVEARAREVAEAREAGARAEHLLAQAAGLLESAAGWATVDLIGGGLLSDLAKHRKMNEAQSQLQAADAALKVFSRELADVARGTAAPLQVDGFSYTFDVWFDNIFSDMAVSRRISQTRDSLGETRLQLQVLRNRLRIEDGELEKRRTALAAEREAVLTAH